MKSLITATAAVLFSTAALAGPLDQTENYGSILLDSGTPPSTEFRTPEGPLVASLYNSEMYGSVLFDRGGARHNHPIAAQAAIGDSNSDDYGSILYDNGRY